jgi:molybdopterin molybdotransferase
MVLVEEALTQILEKIPRLGTERVSLLQAQARVLAEFIPAPRSIPPWDNSAMDGYAVRWQDIHNATPERPVVLQVLGDLPAGSVYRDSVGMGQSVRIMTGAPIPPGADTVIPVENTEGIPTQVRILSSMAKGSNIRRAGEDVQAKEPVLEEGTVLRPSHIGMLSAFQRSFVTVYQKPRVAILSTGDELLEIDQPWEEGKIINSNSYALTDQVVEAGGSPMQLGIARDSPAELRSKIQQGLTADLLITSGGVSVGDYDFVKTLLHEMGNVNFWKVAMRPGQPQAFGMLWGKPLFGLPGNPVSTMVSFELFVRPALLKMQGHRLLFRPTLRAVLQEDVPKKEGLLYLVRCRLRVQEGRIFAITTGEQGSGILSSMVKAQGLAVLPRDISLARAGEEVKVLLLDPLFFHSVSPEYLPGYPPPQK